jgi:hypothetical protein
VAIRVAASRGEELIGVISERQFPQTGSAKKWLRPVKTTYIMKNFLTQWGIARFLHAILFSRMYYTPKEMLG